METLPAEMLELIVRQLTPEDLAHCSAVSRKWYDIFNQDWIWKMHCDAELEEHLRTTPCVATPKFVSPEGENSTLPICQWKLAFLREQHLWMNWKRVENMDSNVNVDVLTKNNIVDVNFLTDSQVVAWYKTHIEILDVSVQPVVCIANTDTTVNINKVEKCSVIGSDMLLVEKLNSIEVYNVDLANKSIMLKHRVAVHNTLKPGNIRTHLIKDHFYIFVNEKSKLIQINNLKTGKILKEEPYPVQLNKYGYVFCLNMNCSPTSDFIVFSFFANGCKLYIYNIKQFNFLHGVEIGSTSGKFLPNCALHKHWLAYTDNRTLTVYNLQIKEVVFSHEEDQQIDLGGLYVFDDGFLIKVSHDGRSLLKCFSPSRQTLTIYKRPYIIEIHKIINNRVIHFHGIRRTPSRSDPLSFQIEPFLLIVSCHKVKEISLSYDSRDSKINKFFTKMLAVPYNNAIRPNHVRYLW